MSNISKELISIVWFKRDLRIHDNAALTMAANNQNNDLNKVLPLYVVKPDYWKLPDSSARHWRFIKTFKPWIRIVIIVHTIAPLLLYFPLRHGVISVETYAIMLMVTFGITF